MIIKNGFGIGKKYHTYGGTDNYNLIRADTKPSTKCFVLFFQIGTFGLKDTEETALSEQLDFCKAHKIKFMVDVDMDNKFYPGVNQLWREYDDVVAMGFATENARKNACAFLHAERKISYVYMHLLDDISANDINPKAFD